MAVDDSSIPEEEADETRQQPDETTTTIIPHIHKFKKDGDIIPTPTGVLAMGAVLDHIMKLDCSCSNLNKVLKDEENDTLKLAYKHHNNSLNQNKGSRQKKKNASSKIANATKTTTLRSDTLAKYKTKATATIKTGNE
jgi:uncharacterized protein (DUF4415 family)